jgi:outer membrane receptor protein involved in Fe transport
MRHLRKILIGGASALALACPIAASAQTAPGEKEASSRAEADSSDIIVTATRREESALEVPGSLLAYSQESLDQKGVRSIDDLTRISPGMTIGVGFGGIKYIAIRGLFSSVGATMTGVYIDETPVQVRSLSLATNFYPNIYDLERVEVLRGPQGTLFGSGAMGGAVRFITAKPSLTDFSGNARGELGITEGGDWSWEAGAAVGGPISQDKVGFRVSANYRRDGGYVDRVPFYSYRGTRQRDSNSRENLVINAALTLAPFEGLKLTPSIFYQQADRHDTDMWWTYKATSPRPQPPRYESKEGFASTGNDRTAMYSLAGEYDLGPVTLISNTALIDRKTRSRDDGTAYLLDILQVGYAFGGIPAIIDERASINLRLTQKAFSQEFRLQSNPDADSRLNYVIGLFYQDARQTATENDLVGTPGRYLLPAPGGVIGTAFDKTRDRQYAAFANVEYEVFDRLTLSAGARISRMEFDFISTTTGLLFGGTTAASGRKVETPITPKFGVEYEVNDDLMLYGSAAKGFRPGGANKTFGTACNAELAAMGFPNGAPREYRSDSVWSYEVGAKGRLGGAATFAVSAFNIDWSDIQRARLVQTCGALFLDNLGKARSRGFDAQITLHPAAGLSFDIGVAYMDATYRQTLYNFADLANPARGPIVRKGDRFAIPWSGSLAADYESNVGSADTKAYGHVQYDFRTAFTATAGTVGFNPVFARTDDQHFVSARLGIRSGSVDTSLFVNNLLDAHDIISRLNFAPSDRVLVQTQRPRTWGITSSVRF